MTVSQEQSLFNSILEKAKNLDPVNTRNWFDSLKMVYFSGGLLEIGCPEEDMVQFLNENCRASFTRAAQQVTSHLVSVHFSCDGKYTQSRIPSGKYELKLHPDYTFTNFVVGPSNRLAHASCVAISQSPGITYNPLFMYGNSGLGKTHLLHAVCREMLQKNPMQIKFLSCEEFVNNFIMAIEQGNLAGFQGRFRNVDALIIDDIQFLREREQSQEEFFHTFNSLYNNSKQIILSADCSPSDIPSLEERLISRFNWGLVTRIDPPSHDTRVAIVKKKAHLRGLDISDEIAEYIARKVQANIRELEGALTRIYAVSCTTQKPVNLELAQIALEGQITPSGKNINITDIIDVVTEYFDVRLADLQSKKRTQSITMPRQICMYLARNLTRHSLEEIGGHLGGRDHTTVMHACSKITKQQETNPKTRSLINELSKQVTRPALK